METVLIILGLVLTILLIAFSGRIVLQPIDRLSKARRRPTRFHIIDFFCLIVEIQVVMAVVFLPRLEISWRIVGLFVVLTTVIVWLKGVNVLSSAGIEDPWRRAAFNWFVLPFTFVTTLVGIPLVAVLLARIVFVSREYAHRHDPPLAIWIVGIAVPGILTLAYFTVHWIVADVGLDEIAESNESEIRQKLPAIDGESATELNDTGD